MSDGCASCGAARPTLIWSGAHSHDSARHRVMRFCFRCGSPYEKMQTQEKEPTKIATREVYDADENNDNDVANTARPHDGPSHIYCETGELTPMATTTPRTSVLQTARSDGSSTNDYNPRDEHMEHSPSPLPTSIPPLPIDVAMRASRTATTRSSGDGGHTSELRSFLAKEFANGTAHSSIPSRAPARQVSDAAVQTRGPPARVDLELALRKVIGSLGYAVIKRQRAQVLSLSQPHVPPTLGSRSAVSQRFQRDWVPMDDDLYRAEELQEIRDEQQRISTGVRLQAQKDWEWRHPELVSAQRRSGAESIPQLPSALRSAHPSQIPNDTKSGALSGKPSTQGPPPSTPTGKLSALLQSAVDENKSRRTLDQLSVNKTSLAAPSTAKNAPSEKKVPASGKPEQKRGVSERSDDVLDALLSDRPKASGGDTHHSLLFGTPPRSGESLIPPLPPPSGGLSGVLSNDSPALSIHFSPSMRSGNSPSVGSGWTPQSEALLTSYEGVHGAPTPLREWIRRIAAIQPLPGVEAEMDGSHTPRERSELLSHQHKQMTFDKMMPYVLLTRNIEQPMDDVPYLRGGKRVQDQVPWTVRASLVTSPFTATDSLDRNANEGRSAESFLVAVEEALESLKAESCVALPTWYVADRVRDIVLECNEQVELMNAAVERRVARAEKKQKESEEREAHAVRRQQELELEVQRLRDALQSQASSEASRMAETRMALFDESWRRADGYAQEIRDVRSTFHKLKKTLSHNSR